MIAIFTDFGERGPYVGQMKAAILAHRADLTIIDLMADVPAFQVQLGAYLLAALVPDFPDGTIFLTVVDPGVGGDRPPVVLRTERHLFVGPGNGLLEIVHRRAGRASLEEIQWQPWRLSASFHGRDLFAPVAARLASGEAVPTRALATGAGGVGGSGADQWPDDLPRIVYVDRFGNAMTGVRADRVPAGATIAVGGRVLDRGRTFVEMAPGQPFWYENSLGLVEIAVNRGRADENLALKPGAVIEVTDNNPNLTV